jgi:molybdenum cofactor cytidylyltransferase
MVVPRVTVDGEALPGNPVIFDAALRDEWLSGASDAACRKWRVAHPGRVRWFDTDNRRYRVDIDTPDDLARFAASTGHTLQWPAAFAQEAVR